MTPSGAQDRFRPFVRRLLYGATRNDGVSRALRLLTSAGLVPASVTIRLPADRTFTVSCPPRSFLYRSSREDLIGRRLYWRGLPGMEWSTLRFFQALVSDRDTFLDIGANTGLYSLVATTMNSRLRAIAFEPVPRVRARLEENLAINALTDRVTVSGEAVGSAEGRSNFHVPYGDVPSSASLNPNGFRGYAGERIEVAVTTVDQARARLGAPLRIMKIDVEGYEAEVLRGASDCLREDRPVVLLECHPDGPGDEITETLAPLGYSFHLLRESGPVVVPRVGNGADRTDYNFLCTPDSVSTVQWTSLGGV